MTDLTFITSGDDLSLLKLGVLDLVAFAGTRAARLTLTDGERLLVNGRYEYREDYPALLAVFDDASFLEPGEVKYLPAF